jgi:hypothetical protein
MALYCKIAHVNALSESKKAAHGISQSATNEVTKITPKKIIRFTSSSGSKK